MRKRKNSEPSIAQRTADKDSVFEIRFVSGVAPLKAEAESVICRLERVGGKVQICDRPALGIDRARSVCG